MSEDGYHDSEASQAFGLFGSQGLCLHVGCSWWRPHLNCYTALQCSLHSNIRLGFLRTRCSCISSFSAANEGAVSLQGISAPVSPSGGDVQQCILEGWDWCPCPQPGKGLPAIYFSLIPLVFGVKQNLLNWVWKFPRTNDKKASMAMISPDCKNFHILEETRVKILNIRNCDSSHDIFPKHFTETQTTEEIRYGQTSRKRKDEANGAAGE